MLGFSRGKFIPTTVVSGIDYADTIITGISATVVTPDRRVWNIFDLLTSADPLEDQHLWREEAWLLGRGHLARMVDSCVRLGLYPDPAELRLDVQFGDVKFWHHAVLRLQDLLIDVLHHNAKEIIAGNFERLYLRVRLEGARERLGPPKPSKLRPAHTSIICEPLGAYAAETCRVVLSKRLSCGSLTDRPKTACNYPGYFALKEEALEAARQMGIEAGDIITIKNIGPNGLLGPGECAAATLGGLWEINGIYTVVVPDPMVHNTLVGRTAWWVMKLAREQLGFKVEYHPITLADLFTAIELWKTGNATYLSSIAAIGRLPLPSTKVGRQLDALLRQAMRGELYPDWSLRVTLKS